MTMRAVTDAEVEAADYVVCCRLTEMPDAPPGSLALRVRERSTIEQCSHCGTDIMVDSRSPKAPPRICLPCAVIASNVWQASVRVK